jgi:hypothetical protein
VVASQARPARLSLCYSPNSLRTEVPVCNGALSLETR